MKTLLLICGVQKAYLHPKGSNFLGEKADIYDIRFKSYLKETYNSDTIVYVIREVHQTADSFFSNIKTSSTVGSFDIEVPEFYKAYSKFFINTMRYNALYATPLESEIYKIKPEYIIMIGFETHTTILFTAEELRNRGYSVTVIEALTTSRDEYLHAAGITLMKNFLSVTVS